MYCCDHVLMCDHVLVLSVFCSSSDSSFDSSVFCLPPFFFFCQLDPEESRWIAYDRVRCPEEWELYSSGEESDESDEEEEVPESKGSGEDDDDGSRQKHQKHHQKHHQKKNKKKKKTLEKPKVPWTRQDLVRIMLAKKGDNLPMQEAKLKKMMTKYHDRRAHDRPPDLGQECRLAYKEGGKVGRALTPEQHEFLLYDRVLHPAWYAAEKKLDKFAGM